MTARRGRKRATLMLVFGFLAPAAQASQGMPPPMHPLASALALPMAPPPPMAVLAPAWDASQSASGADPAEGSQAALFQRNSDSGEKQSRPPVTLSPERAQLMLQSLTVPGWGQLTAGHTTAATVFGIVDLCVWVSYTAFRVQSQMRRDAYIRTARVVAGIDLHGRDEEFQRIVGAFLSSDEYNQLVVARDAANLYYNDPAAFNAYYAEHSLKGADVWVWPDEASLRRYSGQRKDSQRAALRANAALGVAVVNRLLSTIHAARISSTPSAHTWELQTLPADDDPTAVRVGVLRRF